MNDKEMTHDMELSELEKIAFDDGRYDPRAFSLVLEALRRAAPEKKHVSGAKLASGIRDLARELYGISARMVLEHWGLHTTRDIGEVVFLMVSGGVIRAAQEDRVEDFDDVFDLGEELERNYPWGSRS
jgi:uncharacterized repeat protein (TIGR04138 family)